MLFRMSSGVLVQMKGCLRWFHPVMKVRILAIRSATEGNTPRRMACRSMIENQTSTRFSQDPEVGVKWTWKRGFRGQPLVHLGVFVGGVVVHDQVDLGAVAGVGVGPGQVFQEAQELLVAVPVLADPGDLAGGDLERGEQGGGAVADVVVGALLGMAGLHRQHLLGPVQRLDLRLLVHTEHNRVLRRVQIQPDHVGNLGDQGGIGRELERLGPPRLDPVLLPRRSPLCGVSRLRVWLGKNRRPLRRASG